MAIKTPIYFANQACIACPLRQGCQAPVPAVGHINADIMFVGEAPGANEDRLGEPFKGRAGTYLDYLLESINLPRESVWITNTVKCRPANNRDPEPFEIATCSKLWLDMEIQAVQPSIIVALGLFAARYLVGDASLTMEKTHGIPQMVNGRLILPVYHPASGLHNTRNMKFIQEDFAVLGRLLEGTDPTNLIPQDAYPNPDYRVITDVKEARALLSQPKYALDTETIQEEGNTKVWSIQVSSGAGTGQFIPVSIFGQGDSLLSLDGVVEIPPTSQVIAHNYLYDAQFITIPNPIDSMVAAYLLQLPMGLKELAYRYCGMEMHTYEEYVLPYRRKKALSYLYRLASYMRDVKVPKNPKAKNPKTFKRAIWGYPDPPEIKDWEWSNKEACLMEVEKHPHNITGKILERIRKSYQDAEYDPYVKWYDIDQRERQLVESLFGKMPDVDLRDAPFEQAVYYATRDPDATIRWWSVAEGMLRAQGLWGVFEMEMGTHQKPIDNNDSKVYVKNAEIVQQGSTSTFQVEEASSSLAFRSISSQDCKEQLKHHYLGNNIHGIMYAFGDGEAVAAFSRPRSKFLFMGSGLDFVELVRLWSLDNYSGTLSQFLSRCLKELRNSGVDLVYSLADPTAGHRGTIYKATNFIDLGISAVPGNAEFVLDGKRKHPRWFYNQIGTSGRKAVKEYYGDRVQINNRTGKWRFAYPLTRKAKKYLQEWMVKHPPGK